MGVFMAALAVLVVLLAGERLWPARPRQTVEWLNNISSFVLTAWGHVARGLLAPFVTVGLVNSMGGGAVDLTAWPLAWGFLAYLLAMDLGEYLFHRAQHAVPWLWAMHSLHHSDTALNVTTAQRHFWLEPVLKSLTIWLAVALLFKVDAAILSLYAALSLWHFLTHANVRLGFGRLSWTLNSPQYHRLHHSRTAEHYNANYAALLPIFDVVSGAYRRPRQSEFPETGLGLPPPGSGLELIVWPVRGLIRRPATAKRAAA